ncbi:MAG: hypothetical protein WCK01_03225 [Candidatus Uhrbacteria bacterium]
MTEAEVEFHLADMAAVDEERFEWECAMNTKDVFRAISALEIDVQRGVRSVNAVIDSDTQNGLAHQAYTYHGDCSRVAYRLGREWALKNRPTYAELALQDRRHAEARERRDARIAKDNWERGEGWLNADLFCDEPTY